MSKDPKEKPNSKKDPEPAEDYYIENGLMVFTEKYHLKRGHCCNSGCRHCPYKNNSPVFLVNGHKI